MGWDGEGGQGFCSTISPPSAPSLAAAAAVGPARAWGGGDFLPPPRELTHIGAMGASGARSVAAFHR